MELPPQGERLDELAPRVARRDAASREAALVELTPLVRRAIERRLTGAARRWIDPQDVVQVALSQIHAEWNDLDPKTDADELRRRAWRTADLRARDAWRRRRSEVGESELPGGEPLVPQDETGEVTAADTRRWLEGLIAALPPDYAEVVRLCALEGRTPEEAARALGISRDAVYKRYEKARRSLRRRAEDAGD